jgi:outer membrane protein, heavy metal efflux system
MFHAIIIVIVIFLSGPVFALTVDEAVATGLRNNPEMRTFRLEEDAAQGQMQKAKLPPFSNPVIEGGLSLKDRPQAEPGGKFRNNQISLSQSVEVAGQRGLRIDAATNNLERTRFDVRDLERRLRAEVRDKFAEALFLRDKELLTREYLRIQEELSDLVSVKYQAGAVAALEVNLSQVELAKSQRDVIAASTEYRNALLSLRNLIGVTADNALIPEGELAAGLPPLPEREALLARLAERPDVKATDSEIRRAQAAEKLISREAIPNVTWTVFQEGTNNVTNKAPHLE